MKCRVCKKELTTEERFIEEAIGDGLCRNVECFVQLMIDDLEEKKEVEEP